MSESKTNLVVLKQTLDSVMPQIRVALPRHLTAERFSRVVWTQVHANPTLARCTITSVMSSVIRAAERGLVPDGRLGALVPYWNKKNGVFEAQFQPMYQGLIELARRSGQVIDIFPATVCANDEFRYELGLHRDMVHKPALGNRGEPIAYYAVAVLKDGTQTFGAGPMTHEEILKIRDLSKQDGKSSPWEQFFEPMAWKTVIKLRLIKFLPQSEELAAAIDDDNRAEFDLPELSDGSIDDVIMGEAIEHGEDVTAN